MGTYLAPTEMGVKLVLAVASALPQADQPLLQCTACPSPSTSLQSCVFFLCTASYSENKNLENRQKEGITVLSCFFEVFLFCFVPRLLLHSFHNLYDAILCPA